MIPRNPSLVKFSDIVNAFIKPLFGRGDPLKKFESELKKYTGVKNIILTPSGRVSLYVILSSLLSEGDEILVPAFTCNVILPALKASGVIPVFVDIDPETLNMELKQIISSVTPKTKAILATHQFGLICNMTSISEFCKKKDILLIEDSAASFGGEFGSIIAGKSGDIGFYSFERSKVISTYEGGCIITDDAELFKKVQILYNRIKRKNNVLIFIKIIIEKFVKEPFFYRITYLMWRLFSKEKYSNAGKIAENEKSFNKIHRMTKIQAALGLIQLKKIKSLIEHRNKTADIYKKKLEGYYDAVEIPRILEGSVPVYSRFPILLKKIDKFSFHDKVISRGIDLGFSFSYICPEYYEYLNKEDYPVAKKISEQILNIPIEKNIKNNIYIIEVISEVLKDICRNDEK